MRLANELSRIETGYKAQVGDNYLVFTSVDFSKNEGTFKFFDNYESLEKWCHDIHATTHPEWHEQYCTGCELKNETR